MKLAKKKKKIQKILKKILLGMMKKDETLDNSELFCTKTDGIKDGFNRFLFPLKSIEKIHNHEITLDEARNNQTE